MSKPLAALWSDPLMWWPLGGPTPEICDFQLLPEPLGEPEVIPPASVATPYIVEAAGEGATGGEGS
jgi:hypothetical protein